MKEKKTGQLNKAALGESFSKYTSKAWVYRTFIFFLLIASFYGFILWKINTYSNAPPSESEKTAQASAQHHIDQSTLDKIQSLQDNSVGVKTIFDEARNNPFQ